MVILFTVLYILIGLIIWLFLHYLMYKKNKCYDVFDEVIPWFICIAIWPLGLLLFLILGLESLPKEIFKLLKL